MTLLLELLVLLWRLGNDCSDFDLSNLVFDGEPP